ncbi:nuclear transport factor 2 family protein [Agrobacterium sp. SHOUNA12C]|nr:nuclear transport factor 2 family protein [Agrobacterium sp. BETTINA12B]MCJ9758201.1 nuclear transport factor 2 family protein [Agrobacterium sp. SHOUNA12C]
MTSSLATERPLSESAMAHQAGLATIDSLLQALRTGDTDALKALSTSSVSAQASHRGHLAGPVEIAAMFGPFAKMQEMHLSSSNVYLAGTMTRARGSGYLAGRVIDTKELSFGVVFVVDLTREFSTDPWKISGLKVQLTWTEGVKELRPDWTFPVHEKIWTEGDPLPVIVSEVDAPWHVHPNNELQTSDVRDVEDTYARYSWAIDQADFGLLTGCYTEDAAGTFRPMGPLSGRHAIIGVLKDFRRAWPWMQHYGQVLGSVIEGDDAAIIVGRTIPQSNLERGMFGAYYPMRLRRSGALWRITWTEYRPGWFRSADVDMDKLLAVTMSGEGDWAQ